MLAPMSDYDSIDDDVLDLDAEDEDEDADGDDEEELLFDDPEDEE
jgi:hypothetical protein